MEDQAIREGFANLEPSTKYDALYQAALCRERADWIVGINATRLFSCLYGPTLNVGRVMTPTLAMVVMRDAEIAAFKPKPFYTVQLIAGGVTAVSKRFDLAMEANALIVKCKESMKAMTKSVTRKEKSERSPLLYDLTALQRDANRILGFTAQQTLDYTQSLYEKKLVTYPRTDSRYLTEDMQPMMGNLITDVARKYQVPATAVKDMNPTAHASLFDNHKVSDHHAIIPTKTMARTDLQELPSGEQAVLQLIAVRLLCAMSPDYRYAENSIVFTCGDEEFSSKSRTDLDKGWKAIWQHFYPTKDQEREHSGANDLVITENSLLPIEDICLKEGKTTAPKRFTEDTLLSAMESAGADEIPEDAERKGLGTPATRAGVIEKLVAKGFLERKGDRKTKYLVSTDKGNALITVMPEQIRSAAMTADWEQKLLQMERGEYSAEDFMKEITDMISGLTANYEAVKGAQTFMSDHKKVGNCPCCKSDVLEKQKGWFCSNRECRFVLWKDNAFFKSLGKHLTTGMVEKLLADGRLRLKDCRSQRTGKNYNATLLLSTEDDGRASFHLEFEPNKNTTKRRKGGAR